MRNQPTWMWAEAFDLLERADRLHRQFFRFERSAAQAPRWEPPVDVVETRDGPSASNSRPRPAR